ncbi:MAG TPA: heparinase II/III family protein [Verrucomicrobiae bacterium]|nr:heparinase II/III family protein [Verrucomicrobiae bacterium]
MNLSFLYIAIGFAVLSSSITLQAADDAQIATAQLDTIVAHLNKSHPRLLANEVDFAILRTQVEKNPILRRWVVQLRATCETILTQEPSKYEIDGGNGMLVVSRRVLDRVSHLALLYRLDGNKKWLDRAWIELDAAAKFKDWYATRHFLDTAEMTMAFAIAYDWLYDDWTPEQRAILKDAIVEKGLKPALPIYRKQRWWTVMHHNWNQVCNGGLGVGALAIGDEEPALCEEILQNAIKSLPLAMQHFAPDGAWNEGPGYWNYGTKYNVFILAAMDTALGTDYGLSQIPGFSLTGDFPPYFSGPIGKTFNYADSGDLEGGAAQIFWLAAKFNHPGWAAWQLQQIEGSIDPGPFNLLWGARWLANADGSEKSPPQMATLPLGRYFRAAEVVTMRNLWTDTNAIFIGFKAGDNKANHSHLDLGSFVMDALGQRWAIDLGADDYNLPGYFDFSKQRWTYYRTRAESHNTIVLNPDEGPDQNSEAFTRIVKADMSHTQFMFAVADLTPAYAKNAQSVKRGIALINGQQVLVQDEIVARNPAHVFWFMHTPAQIDISKDGKTATLILNQQTMSARLLDPKDAKFSILDAAPLPTSPNPAGQKDNKSIESLTVELQGATNLLCRVLLTPSQTGQSTFIAPKEKDLNDW